MLGGDDKARFVGARGEALKREEELRKAQADAETAKQRLQVRALTGGAGRGLRRAHFRHHRDCVRPAAACGYQDMTNRPCTP